MANLPKSLRTKLEQREAQNALRQLGHDNSLIDFSSNDYLGFSKLDIIYKQAHGIVQNIPLRNGSTGSRLLTGNHSLYEELESALCQFHNTEAALVFNSGYDANIGFFECVPQRHDIILYDEFIHASIRDGIRMSPARAYKFAHNNLSDLKEKLSGHSISKTPTVYVVTESVFSMDGDSPDLPDLCNLIKKYNAYLIVDEAHATGVFGDHGQGFIQKLGLEQQVFARLVTFGKGLGCHGAAVLGSSELKTYLINFGRSLIYTTALPPHAIATAIAAFDALTSTTSIKQLHHNTDYFKARVVRHGLESYFIPSHSAIHSCIIPGNDRVKHISGQLKHKGFDVKPILSPTVPEGKERLRFCLHSYNSEEEISEVLSLLATFVK